jgi:hypothetical protein
LGNCFSVYTHRPEHISEDHSGWTAWVATKGVTIFFTVFMYVSTLFCVYERKLSEAEAAVERQKEKLLKLVEVVNTLKEKNKENERRVEMQQHELMEQETILRELYIALQVKNDSSLHPCVHLLRRKDTPKEFWLFRKHQRNLLRITEPYINQVIEASVEADIVPEHVVEESSETCSSPDHRCSVFYKALQMRISESPDIFATFLRILQEQMRDSKPHHTSLCSKILAELNTI